MDTAFLLAKAALPLLTCPFLAATASNILYERWDGIPGDSISDLTNHARYPDDPTNSSYLHSKPMNVSSPEDFFFEAPSNIGDFYGMRLTGYFLAPETGNYTFVMASDDSGQLLLDDAVYSLYQNVYNRTFLGEISFSDFLLRLSVCGERV